MEAGPRGRRIDIHVYVSIQEVVTLQAQDHPCGSGASRELAFRAHFPWLLGLPGELLARLDWAEFQVPIGAVADVVRRLEGLTGQFAMTYREQGGHRAAGTVQLCRVIEAAPLSEVDLAVLVDLERTLPGVRVVLYRNPLRLRSPVVDSTRGS